MISLLKRILLPILLITTITTFGQELKIEKLGNDINTNGYDEISPVLSRDGKTLYFTRVGSPEFNRTLMEEGKDLSVELNDLSYQAHLKSVYTRIAERYIKNPQESGFNQDIWIAHSQDAITFDHVSHPGYPLNNALPNSVCSLTPNGNEVVVINQFNAEKGGMKKGFSISRKIEEDKWTFPQSINIKNYYNSDSDVSMALSLDGQIMILSMDRSDSRGKSDLYISFKIGPNDWSSPKNLGSINSYNRETTPFLSADNKRLFFSSDRRGTGGGNDLFYVDRIDNSWENWGGVQRLSDPINSSFDDSQPIFNSASGYLYFTSKRDGSSDIFRVKLAPPNPVTVKLKGRVLNSKTLTKVPNSEILSGFNEPNSNNIYFSTDGTYKMTVPKGGDFKLIAQKQGYVGQMESVHFKKSYVYHKEYKVDLLLDPVEPGSKINLDNIYFVRSKPEIKEESFPAIDELAEFLKENQHISITIEGHTDNQGDNEILKQLSEQRAEAIKEYLVYKKRIRPLRINTIGYGAEKPVNDNSTEELRQMNRRVEFRISKIFRDEDKS